MILLFQTIQNLDCFFKVNYERVLYVDMDNVLVDFRSAFPKLSPELLVRYQNDLDEVPGIFGLMEPMPGALQALEHLFRHFDIYLLSTAPWNNPSAWSDKLEWVQKYLPVIGYKRLILTHNKQLNQGRYLIDDRIRNGVPHFAGTHLHFGTECCRDWQAVVAQLVTSEALECTGSQSHLPLQEAMNEQGEELRI